MKLLGGSHPGGGRMISATRNVRRSAKVLPVAAVAVVGIFLLSACGSAQPIENTAATTAVPVLSGTPAPFTPDHIPAKILGYDVLYVETADNMACLGPGEGVVLIQAPYPTLDVAAANMPVKEIQKLLPRGW